MFKRMTEEQYFSWLESNAYYAELEFIDATMEMQGYYKSMGTVVDYETCQQLVRYERGEVESLIA